MKGTSVPGASGLKSANLSSAVLLLTGPSTGEPGSPESLHGAEFIWQRSPSAESELGSAAAPANDSLTCEVRSSMSHRGILYRTYTSGSQYRMAGTRKPTRQKPDVPKKAHQSARLPFAGGIAW